MNLNYDSWTGMLTGDRWALLAVGAICLALLALIRSTRHNRARRVLSDELTQARVELAACTAKLDSASMRVAELVEERDNLTDALHRARSDTAALERSLDAMRHSADRDAENAAREIQTLKDLRAEMSAQFRLMADESLRRQSEDLERTHAERLSSLLTPFREQVARFQDEIQAGQRAGESAQAMLREHIEGLHRRSEEIGRDAVALTRALKGDKQRQGAWGEMILAQVLEAAGLVAGQHFRTQVSVSDDDGRRFRPDVVVDMPGGRSLVIDAKLSLNAYAEASAAEDDAAREAHLRRHVAAIRAHVAELAARGYQALDEGTVDYVIMFLPIEGAFAEALRVAPKLTAEALEKRVGIATPSTLMLALRTVEHLWAVERREKGAAEIAARAGALYDKLAGVVGALQEAGTALDAASRAHAAAVGRLSRGPGNVIRQAELLRELGARTTKVISLSHDTTDRTGSDEAGPVLIQGRNVG